ncbi:hypothetical protein AB0H30_23045 [Streptomyces pseudogriseolus]|uniref:hypothetical protein n=1 Tax=Streptomyces pseudogriseolus TaxID=36817 RepID=UPI00348B8BB5
MPLNSPALLTSAPARRLLRSVADLVDRRIERRLRTVEAAHRKRLREVTEAALSAFLRAD